MPLMILGFVFAVGLFIFYLASTSNGGNGGNKDSRSKQPDADKDLKKEDNVIFLPNDIEKAKEMHRKNK